MRTRKSGGNLVAALRRMDILTADVLARMVEGSTDTFTSVRGAMVKKSVPLCAADESAVNVDPEEALNVSKRSSPDRPANGCVRMPVSKSEKRAPYGRTSPSGSPITSKAHSSHACSLHWPCSTARR